MHRLKEAKVIAVLVFLLVIFGLVVLSSAGVVDGQKKFGSPSYYFVHQLLFGLLPGVALFLIFSRLDYKIWRSASLPLLLVAIGFLVLVFVPGFGFGTKGAQRWVDLGLFSFQPAELLKLALILYLAAWFGQNDSRAKSGLYSAAPFFIVMIFAGALLLLQPDMGTLALILIIALSMYFFAGVKLSRFVGLILLVAVLLGVFSVLEPYRFERLKVFLDPSSDKQGAAYHINQALLGIGSGGIFGLGFGQSRQKLNYLPEPVGDSIFAVVVEELGFVGAAVLIALFLSLIIVLVAVAKNSSTSFGRLIVLGMAVWIAAQTLVNMSAISGLIPLTGIPLPFISFGSSSLVSLLWGLGIAASVAKHG